MVFAEFVEQARVLTAKGGDEALFAFPVVAVVADHSGDNKVIYGADNEVCILTLTSDRIALFGVEQAAELGREAVFEFDRMTPMGIQEGTDSRAAALAFYCGDRRVSIHDAYRIPEFDTMATFSVVQSASGSDEAASGAANAGDGDEASSGSANAAPGWYPDPQGVSQLRYWDGHIWTDHRA